MSYFISGAILVVAATDGQMPQTVEHLLLGKLYSASLNSSLNPYLHLIDPVCFVLTVSNSCTAKQVGVENVVVFVNKADIAGQDVLELVEIEIRDLLCDLGYDGGNCPVIFGSALLALNGDATNPFGEQSIIRLIDAMDSFLPILPRDLKSPFMLPIDSAFTVPGRGTVAVGTIKRGTIKKNADCELLGFDAKLKASVSDIQVFKKSVDMAVAGDNVGVLLRGIKLQQVTKGMMLCQYGSELIGNHYEAKIYFLTKAEGGRSKPITTKYCQQLFSRTWSIACRVDLLDQNLIMPGEHATVRIVLWKKMVMNMGQQFTIRENKSTVATGIILKALDSVVIEHSLGRLNMGTVGE